MALPFIAGIAIGVGAMVLFNKNKSIQKSVGSLLNKGKDAASCGYEKTKDMASEVKDTVSATKDCIIEKKEQIQKTKADASVENEIEVEKDQEEYK